MRCAFLSALTILAWVTLPVPASAQEPAPVAATQKAPDPAAALAIYAEGKKAYDAGDYLTARSKFILTIKRDPNNARWYYNLGLVHRQLDNIQAARQALLKARELDPNYKKSEIDKKLASMGFGDGASTPAATPANESPASKTPARADNPEPHPLPVEEETFIPWEGLAIGGGFLLVAVIGLIAFLRGRSSQAAPTATPLRAALEGRLRGVAAQLAQVEHALRLGEHPDLRNQLEYATRAEATARHKLTIAVTNDKKSMQKLTQSLDEASNAAAKAVALATQVHGPAAFAGQGEAVGCFFCARPLANPDVRRIVSMKRGETRQEVLSCPDCAAQAGRGESPAVRTGPDGQTHWSEVPGFDPYSSRHGLQADGKRVPVWQFQPARPVADIARTASGGLLGGAGLLAAGAAVAAPLLFDLDSARQSGLAQEALKASARQASGERSSSFSDHS